MSKNSGSGTCESHTPPFPSTTRSLDARILEHRVEDQGVHRRLDAVGELQAGARLHVCHPEAGVALVGLETLDQVRPALGELHDRAVEAVPLVEGVRCHEGALVDPVTRLGLLEEIAGLVG